MLRKNPSAGWNKTCNHNKSVIEVAWSHLGGENWKLKILENIFPGKSNLSGREAGSYGGAEQVVINF